MIVILKELNNTVWTTIIQISDKYFKQIDMPIFYTFLWPHKSGSTVLPKMKVILLDSCTAIFFRLGLFLFLSIIHF